MRKIIVFLLLAVMVAGLAVPALAAQGDLTMADASAQAGELVYLTVNLSKKVTGDTMGISYTYDAALLDPAPDACQWLQKGTLQDFGQSNDSGVWTVEKKMAITGDICLLAFRVREGASFSETKVGCTLLIKNGTKKAGEFTAEAKVTMTCNHTFGPWAEDGSAGHARTCTVCGANEFQSHSWDGGVLSADPNTGELNIKTWTCEICGAKKTQTVAGEADHTIPTAPKNEDPQDPEEDTRPEDVWRPGPNDVTFPDKERPGYEERLEDPTTVTRPGQNFGDHDHESEEETSLPTVWQPSDYNEPEEEHDHSHDIEDLPDAIPAVGNGTQQAGEETVDPHEGHDHTQTPNGATAIIVCAVVLIAVVGAVIYLKKKR